MKPMPTAALLRAAVLLAVFGLPGALRAGEGVPSILDFMPPPKPAPEAAGESETPPPPSPPEPAPVFAPGETPSILVFMPKKEEAPAPDEVPTPAVLTADALARDPAALLPAGALAYLEAPNTTVLNERWRSTPFGKVMADERVERFVSVNGIGLRDLFRDLPAAIAPIEKVNLLDAALVAARKLPPAPDGAAAFAVYAGDLGELSFAYLLDVGGDREAAWSVLEAFGDAFAADFTFVERASVRVGDFRDRYGFPGIPGARLEAGFCGNFAFLTNQPGLVSAAGGAGARLSSDPALGRIRQNLESAKARSGAQAVPLFGFVRPGGIMRASSDVPAGERAARAMALLFGGATDPNAALRYVVHGMDPGGVQEQWLCPTAAEWSADFPSWLKQYGHAPEGGWDMPRMLPLNPGPVFAVAAQVSDERVSDFFRAMQILEAMVTDGLDATGQATVVLKALSGHTNGQVAFGFGNALGDRVPWMVVAGLKRGADAAGIMQQYAKAAESAGIPLYNVPDKGSGPAAAKPPAPGEAETPAAVWAVVGGTPGRLPEKAYLIGASHLDLMQRWIDQLSSGRQGGAEASGLVAMAETSGGKGASLIARFDTAAFFAARYSGLDGMLRRYYPRLSNLSSKPPLSLARGLGPVEWMARPGGDGIVLAVASPVPTAPTLALGNMVAAPSWIRERGRRDLMAEADRLKQIWLRLQWYQARNGYFPANLDDFAKSLPEADRSLLDNPAAAGRLGGRAAGEAFGYLAGLSPNDDAKTPMLFDARPWHNDFAGRFQAVAPGDTGPYKSYRLVLRLDGEVSPMDEETFQQTVMPRLQPPE